MAEDKDSLSAEQAVISGKVWEDFCDELKAAGAVVQRELGPDNAFDRAEGYRYLTRLLRGALESFMEYKDPAFPVLRCACHETIKMGADNPDNYYMSTPVRADYEYRLIGKRGTVDYLGFSTVNNQYGRGGGMETTGFLDSRHMEVAEDGSFEIILSKEKKPGNWVPMTDATNQINVRQTFQDRENEIRAEIRIERLGADKDRPAPLTPKQLQRNLLAAGAFVKNTSTLFANWVESFIPDTNAMPPADQAFCQAIGGDPNIYYFHNNWQLADDECLVITAEKIPQCQTWNFQLDNWWMESLDYRYHKIHVNKHTAHYETDGSVKVIVAHQDPGHPNWIETAGHNLGSMCWRWIGAEEHPGLKTQVLKLADFRQR